MKKFLAIFLAVVMTVSMVSTAFAARYTDVANSDYGKAIENLSGLGIIAGYDDGSYQPAKVVTRAEMAKLLVVSLGLDVGASVLQGKSSFDDVPTTHWATGYIAVAVQYGLIKGDGDGNFRPDDTVNYAEAATMVLRALGYDRVVDKTGVWPTNYLNKANELKIFDEINSVVGANGATRGTVAQMMWNMLNTQMWEVGSESESNGLTYGKGETMLTVKFPKFNTATTTAGVTTYAPNYLEAKQLVSATPITIVDADTIDVTFETGTPDTTVRFDNVSPLEFNAYSKYDILYTVEKVDGVNKNIGKSIYADNSLVVVGKVEKITSTKVTINGVEYEKASTYTLTAKEGQIVVLNLDTSDKVVAETIYAATNSIIIDKITTNKDGSKTTYDVNTASDNAKILIDNTKKDLMFVTFNANGTSKVVAKADIKVGMVMEQYAANSLYVVTDKEVSGTVSKIVGSTLGTGLTTDLIATISGVDYRFDAKALILLASKTSPEDLTVSLVQGLIGENILANLDSENEIVYIEADDSITAKNFGFVTKAWTTTTEGATTYNVRVMGLNGVTTDYVTYDFKAKKSAELTWIATHDVTTVDHFLDGTDGTEKAGLGVLIEYELEDGKIVKLTAGNVAGKANTIITDKAIGTINETSKTFIFDSNNDGTVDDVTLAWNSNTKAYQYEITPADYKVDTKAFDIKDLDVSKKYIVIYDATTKVADYILYKGTVSTDKVYGIISEVSSIVGKDEDNTTIYGTTIYDIATDTEVTLQVGTTANTIVKGKVVSYVQGTDGYYDLTDETANKLGTSAVGFNPTSTTYVYDVGDNQAIVLAAATVITTGNVEVIYIDANGEVDDTKDLSDMNGSDEVYGVSYIEKVNSTDTAVYDVIVVVAK